jgi:esterase/lipase superfamily enzyme
MLLDYNNYTVPLIGFSWNSLPPYPAAKNNAVENGPELAKFISTFKNRCPDSDIRIIAHSLGTEVVKTYFDQLKLKSIRFEYYLLDNSNIFPCNADNHH